MKSLYESMLDPELFGTTFAGESFRNWRTVAKILDGLPLEPAELDFYKQVTGREAAPTNATSEAYLIKPRRAGGTLFAAGLGVHASLPQDNLKKLGPGEVATVAMIASDRRQARQLMNYSKGLIADSTLISDEVIGVTQESISFAHRVNLEVHTTSFRSTRGYSYAAVILDELAYFRDDLSANPDVELIRAVRPGLANLKGRLLGLSSPHAKRGHLFEMYRQHYGQPSDVLILKADHTQLNPTLDPKVIERAMAEDPEAARSEWFGEFRSDISQFLPDELIDAAVVPDRPGLPASRHEGYAAFVDVSGGVSDASVLGIAHRAPGTRAEHFVLDQLIVAPAPHKPHEVVARFAEVLQNFGLRKVVGDRYGAGWVTDAFRHYSIGYEHAELDKSAIYAEVAPLFAERRVELLDHKRLITELRLLERRPRTGGRGDSIDHPPRAHDDCANAACGALWLASRKLIRSAASRGQRAEYAEM